MQHNLGLNWSGGTTINSNVSLQADGENNRDIALTAGQTNLLVAFNAVRSNTLLMYILSNVNAVIKTNSSSAPGDTITLTAGVPWLFYQGGPACPLAADITSLYVTNSNSTTAGTVNIRCLGNF